MSDEQTEPTYNGGLDEDGFPLGPPRRKAESLLERRGEQARREREGRLAAQRAKVARLDRIGDDAIVYPDGQGQTPTEEDAQRLSGPVSDPWWDDLNGPTHTPRGEGL